MDADGREGELLKILPQSAHVVSVNKGLSDGQSGNIVWTTTRQSHAFISHPTTEGALEVSLSRSPKEAIDLSEDRTCGQARH